ncbi:MAG: hypothetical protein IJA36_00575 [Lachnospiraceae bacterium]|nr:hypothetical protein [Lachnospiraceae bacterium]
MEQESFAKAIGNLKEIAKAYENILAVSDIKEELKELNLTEEQLKAVYEYLLENNIQIPDYNGEKENKEDIVENEEDSKFFQMYMDEIKELKEIPKEQLEEIFWKAVEGDGNAREQLVSGYLNQIVDFAKIYRNQGVLLEDLVQEGNIGLLNGIFAAAEQPEIENIENYLAEQICESMENAIYETETESKAEDYLVKQMAEVDKCINEFEQENHRKPFAEELADIMRKDIEEVKDIMKYLK